MLEIDPIENWLNTVAFSHSNSEKTRRTYKDNFQKLLTYAKITPMQIIEDYNKSTEKEFKQKYTPIVMSLIGKMQKQNYSPCALHNTIATIKSFFKYNNLPLNFIPSGKQRMIFHNRDIEKRRNRGYNQRSRTKRKSILRTYDTIRIKTSNNLQIKNKQY